MQKPRSAATKAIRWDDARVLLALLATRSLSAAGKQLGVEPSTVSRRLDALEAALGARLFDRTPDGVAATALAEELGPHAEAMARAADGLALAAEGREALPEGDVVITAPPGYAEYFLAPALPRLHAAHPRLRVTLDASTRVADLARREADLAIRGARPESGDLVARKLADVHPALLASPKYAASLAPLRRLRDARFITWGPELSSIAAAQLIQKHVPPENIVLRTSHLGTQVAAAEAGLGVVALDRTIVRATSLVEVELAPELAKSIPRRAGEMWLVGHRALRDVPRIAAVWAFLIEETDRSLRAPPVRATKNN